MDKEKIYKLIDNCSVVSFDIFDTLLKRDIEKPTDLFYILQNEGIKKYGVHFTGFYNQRILAEKKARLDYSREIKLDEIYNKISGFTSFEIEWAKSREVELEYQYCSANLPLLEIYDYCLKNDKKTIIVSDMYLSKLVLEKMLNKIGVCEFDSLWVSSELRLTKAKGDIFNYIEDKLNIDGKNVVHIGDNKKSDYLNARKAGWNAILVERYIDNLKYHGRIQFTSETINEKIVREFINNNILSIPSKQRLGYENMGPLLYGFSIWLLNELKKQDIEKVFFLSRDGLILKRAFDIVNVCDNITSKYLYASRRSLQVPVLAKNLTYSDFLKRIHWPPVVDIRYFLYSLGIDDDDILGKILNKYNIDVDYKISREYIENNDVFSKIFVSESSLIKENAELEKKALCTYLEQEDFTGKLAIVDIGWYGNMQVNISNFSSSDIFGYYIGVKPQSKNSIVKMRGYIFDDNKNEKVLELQKDINALFEQIFMANHGSVRNFEIENGISKVKLYKFEQIDEESIDILRDYQAGALRFVKDLFLKYGSMYIKGDFAVSGVLQQFLYPTYEDAKKWGKISFKDESTSYFIVDTDKLRGKFLRPKAFLKSYKNSLWKEGFLKVNFKINIDYLKLIKFMKIISFRK